MLYNGANGETADDLRTLLRFEQNNLSDHEVNNGFRELLSQICSKNSENLKFSIANRAIVSQDFRIKIEYENNLKKNFNASIKSMDLVKDGFIAIQIINDWIEAQTNGKIKKLFETPFDPLTKLVLLNVVYFKGLSLLIFINNYFKNIIFFYLNN
jgi:serpin B